MKVLVTWGSAHGGTEGIARVVADTLTEAGHKVWAIPADQVQGLERWDAVVVGGALYAWHWQRKATRFVFRHIDELRRRPVWFFSSGPLDDSASQGDIAPVRSVRRMMLRVAAQGHVTFGGRMTEEARRGAMPVGDWRDMDRVREWSNRVAAELDAIEAKPEVREQPGLQGLRRLVIGLCLFTGITALVGGIGLFASPGGGFMQMPLDLLDPTPFTSYRLPGILLFILVGLPNCAAAIMERRGFIGSEYADVAAGAALTIWMVVEMAMMHTSHWLQISYLVIGVATLLSAFWLYLRRHMPPTTPRLASAFPEPVA